MNPTRPFKFIYVHWDDWPTRFGVSWEDDKPVLPTATPTFRTVNIEVVHHDFNQAEAIAKLLYNTARYEAKVPMRRRIYR